MGKRISVEDRIYQLVDKHGSLRAAARVLNMDHAYLHRLCIGTKVNPSAGTLRKLGLRKAVVYELCEEPSRG